MARLFYHVMQDNVGNLLFDVSGTMRLAGSGTLATIYGDEGLTAILPNPMTNHPSFGSFKCYLAPGSYDFYMAKAGYSFETLTGVQGLGTMALQNASAVSMTGGTAALWSLVTGGVSTLPPATVQQVWYVKNSTYGISIAPTDNDTGPATPIRFLNTAGTAIGSISTTASATAYNTTSDARLKELTEALVGALDVVRALRPISFRWRSDGSVGHGFLASEVATVVPGVITGEPDAVDEAGQIVPQMIDYSKLVVWVVAALQELAVQVQALRNGEQGAA